MYKKFIIMRVKKLESAFNKRSIKDVKKIQYECIEHMAIEFNHNIFNLAIICYMLSKMLAKPRYWQTKGKVKYLNQIKNSLKILSKNSKEEKEITKTLEGIMTTISNMDLQDKKHIYNLVEGAKIKIGASLYAKGMTLGVASDLSGADKTDILKHIGKTTMYENLKEPVEISYRIKKVREIFGD